MAEEHTMAFSRTVITSSAKKLSLTLEKVNT
jgi:hypothetical protein